MDITKIDENMQKRDNVVTVGDKDVYTIPHPNFDLYGIYYDEVDARFRRMPQEVAETVSASVKILCKNTAGGRLRFSTDANEIVINAEYDSLAVTFDNGSAIGNSAFVLLEELDDGTFWSTTVTRMVLSGTTNVSSARLKGVMRNYILYFPNYNNVKSLTLSFNAGAKVVNGKKYKDIKPIIYYGSSITQGGCASRADASYQAIISKWNNIDFINLGFSGCGKAEKTMVDYVCSLDCSLFVLDYDYNADSADYLRATHYPFYEAFRKAHPETPILMVSKPDMERGMQEVERQKVIRASYLKAKRNGDKNVYFYNGKNFFNIKNREICTVDKTHPNTLGMYLMAQKLYKQMKKIDKVFE